MAKDVNPPRGMRDFLPAEKAKRDRVLGAIRETYKSHGYQEIETPALEDLSRLTSGQGGDNEKLAYRVMKRGEELERALADTSEKDNLADLGLRFDLTVPLTRYYATNAAKLPRVFKAIQTGPVWRAERPQKGRYRQFVQCDIDVIGDSSVLAEIDLLVSSLDALKANQVHDAKIRINDRRILNAFLESAQIPEHQQPQALIEYDKLDKKPAIEILQALTEMSNNARELTKVFNFAQKLVEETKASNKVVVEALQPVLAANQRTMNAFRDLLATSILTVKFPDVKLPDFSNLLGDIRSAFTAGQVTEDELETLAPRVISADTAFRELNLIINAVESIHPGKIIFDPSLVRGMGYYTGTIFEIEHPASGSSIGGGGRYDGMVGRWTGTDVAAVGISIGFERVVDLVADTDAGFDGVVLVLDDESQPVIAHALAVQKDLIAAGHAVRLEQRPKKLNILLDALAEQGFTSWAAVDGSGSKPELKPLA